MPPRRSRNTRTRSRLSKTPSEENACDGYAEQTPTKAKKDVPVKRRLDFDSPAKGETEACSPAKKLASKASEAESDNYQLTQRRNAHPKASEFNDRKWESRRLSNDGYGKAVGSKKSELKASEIANYTNDYYNPFSTTAINKYIDWLAEKHGLNGSVVVEPEWSARPEFTQIFGGERDCLIETEMGVRPVVVRQVYQNRKYEPKSIEALAYNRGLAFYLEPPTSDDEKWRVRKGTKQYFEMQNILAKWDFDTLDLILFSQHGNFIKVIEVPFEREAYLHAFEKARDYLLSKDCLRK